MASLTVSKLKSYLPFGSKDNITYQNSKSTKRIHENLSPEIGFQINLDPGSLYDHHNRRSSNADDKSHRVPELLVRVLGARHLPGSFGLKSVQGYVVKIKLFPGSTRYDSSIQTSSWPTFNETFNFPLEPSTKSSFKMKHRKPDSSQSVPQHLFRGHFVVLTVFALLELPPGAIPTMREKLKRFRRKSLLNSEKNNENPDNDNAKKDIMSLTTSEMKRNLGSVTYFLDPKLFEENPKTHFYSTQELWMPIKDIAPQQQSSSMLTGNTSVNTSIKGQVEIILQLTDESEIDENFTSETTTTTTKSTKENVSKKNWNEMKKLFTLSNRKNAQKGLCLKVSTSKMRCSIKVKEEYENVGNTIYIKTTVFEHGILSNSWKSDTFAPSLSTRWNIEDSTVTVPLNKEEDLENITIKVYVATKTSMGKKIVFGTVNLGPISSPNHWQRFISSRENSIALWHNFE